MGRTEKTDIAAASDDRITLLQNEITNDKDRCGTHID